MRFVPDAVEALTRLGRTDEARALLDRYERHAGRLGRASAIAASERCRGLLAAADGDPQAALAAFERSLAGHESISLPFDIRARTLLDLGAALRRAKRRRAARERLGQALEIFETLGAPLWTERARDELGRIGGAPVGGGRPGGGACRRARGAGQDEPRGGGRAVRHRPDDRVPPLARLREARHPLTRGARAAVRREDVAKSGDFHVSRRAGSRLASAAEMPRSLLLAVLAVALCACGGADAGRQPSAATPESAPARLEKTFASDRYGYTIRYLAGWSALAAARPFMSDELLSYTSDSADKLSEDRVAPGRPELTIAARAVPEGTTLDAHREDTVRRIFDRTGCRPTARPASPSKASTRRCSTIRHARPSTRSGRSRSTTGPASTSSGGPSRGKGASDRTVYEQILGTLAFQDRD